MTRDHLSLKYISTEEEDKIEVIVREIIRIETGQIIGQVVEIEDSLGVDPDLNRTMEGTTSKTMLENMEDNIAEGNIEMIVIDEMVTIEVGIDQERGCSQEVTVVIELGVQAVVGLGQDPEPVLTGIGYYAIIVESMITCKGLSHLQRRKGFRSITTKVKFGRKRTNMFVE